MNFQQYLMKILSISKIGLKFSKDPYALENYQEVETLTLEQLSQLQDVAIDTNPYSRDLYPTVNVSVRTIVTNSENQVLMVKEASENLWSFPGGWCDVFESPQENAKKEVYQESGYEVKIERLLAVFFRDNYKPPIKSLVSEYCIYFHAKLIKQVKSHNHEILEVGFFDIDDLPPLSFKNSDEEVSRSLNCLMSGQSTFD